MIMTMITMVVKTVTLILTVSSNPLSRRLCCGGGGRATSSCLYPDWDRDLFGASENSDDKSIICDNITVFIDPMITVVNNF